MLGRKKPSRKTGPIAALDVGTSKVAAIVAELDEDGAPRILGSHQVRCQGVQNGVVTDLAATEAAIRQAVDKAERHAGLVAESVTVGISAGGLESDIAQVEVELGGQRIDKADLDLLHGEGRARIDPGDRAVLHAAPALYTIDGQGAVLNPVGLHARTLGAAIHIVSADAAPLKNLETAVRSADLHVDAIVASPLASGRATLTKEEREIGVALVEIGAGVTNIAIFAQDLLAGFASLPMGGQAITEDIASALGTPRAAAERLKALKGSASALPRDNHELIDVPAMDGSDTQHRRPRAELVHAIRARLDILFGSVAEHFQEIGFVGPRAHQVVLTGGGAALAGIADYAESVLGKQVRVGVPTGLSGVADAQRGPAYATVAGLLLYASDEDKFVWDEGMAVTRPRRAASSFSRIFEALKAGL